MALCQTSKWARSFILCLIDPESLESIEEFTVCFDLLRHNLRNSDGVT